MTTENLQTATEIEELNEEFLSIHQELINKGEYKIAEKLSKVYYESKSAEYKSGVEWTRELYNN